METIEERVARLEYYNRLTVQSINLRSYPFYSLVMEKHLTEEEVEGVLSLCDVLQQHYEVYVDRGYTQFLPLLLHFAGMLSPKLKPKATIQALLAQDLYRDLMLTLDELAQRYE
ncbi:hypothetical protein A374_08464 [Fictibacillus macauensis ZFHKF-1]|uniref:DUF1878 domain-containing protein n=1 Tax=Fictibacillus macauensis ZFHKF-1 TaxID=1196324 RepID=I8AJY3_9BACL|nr:DUF1878 family protein [Fictibacillus macauensis]EIT85854.1 hypothetical protein A374_08464 [Fictibacillus macauensis ZFHKF-1]